MDSQTQKQQPNSKSILDMAQKAMRDMDALIKEMRQVRSNVNRLVQTAPADKPSFLLEASTCAEAKLRQAKTDLNLWMQKHFRGGEEWLDQPEQPDHSEPDEKFNLGHNHYAEVVNGGLLHLCNQLSCRHYSDTPSGSYPTFTEGHDEHGTMVGDGNIIWTCPNESCRHFRRIEGEDVVDFSSGHAHLQISTSDEDSDDLLDYASDDEDSRELFSAVYDSEEYFHILHTPRFHDSVVRAYRWRNEWCENKVETAYPNC